MGTIGTGETRAPGRNADRSKPNRRRQDAWQDYEDARRGMMLVGPGLVALFFVGPPGGTAGNILAEAQIAV